MQLNLLVLRARDPKGLAAFYASLGLVFQSERHGTGPEHLSCETGGGLLEIYPCRDESKSTRSARLGFTVDDLDSRCTAVVAGSGRLLREPHATQWGRRATIEDPEGHTIDLLQVEMV
jgi:predicted enzyme related to lactoylglutathione lyase